MSIVYKTPLCSKCKKPMIAKKGKFGDFFGCVNYPACKFTSKTKIIGGRYEQDGLKDNVMPGDFNTRKG